MTLICTAYNHRLVILDARSSSSCTALAAKDILFKVLLGEFKTGWNSVHDHSDEFSMRLTENRNSEFSSECIHIILTVFR